MKTMLPDSLTSEIEALTREQRRELAAMLRRMIAEELAPEHGDPHECPLCHCERFVRKGKAGDGVRVRLF